MAQRTGQTKVLGLAIGEKSLVICEASRAGEGPRVTSVATFPFPSDQGLEHAGALGQSLAEFLKEKGFTARQAVVGVPARWVLSKPKEVPPAGPSDIAEALRMQVEGEFSQELRDLTFDYAGQTSQSESRGVLLVALQGKHLEQIKSLAAAANLQLAGVTPIGCVLGAATGMLAGKARHAMLVSVGPGGVEFAAVDGASPRVLRHLGGATSSPALLAGELRRATFSAAGGAPLAGAAVNGNGAALNGHGPSLIIWDGSTLNDSYRKALSEAAGARIEQGDLQSLGVFPGLDAGESELAGAAAVAIAALSDEPLPADFLHSKLAQPKASGMSRQKILVIAAAAAIVLLVVYGWLDLRRKESAATALQAQVSTESGQVSLAQAFMKKVEFAQNWHQGTPRFLDCLLDLESTVPQGTAYAMTFSLTDNLRGTLTGKASDNEAYLALYNKINNNTKRFGSVKAGFTKDRQPRAGEKQSGRTGEEVTFQISFTYLPSHP